MSDPAKQSEILVHHTRTMPHFQQQQAPPAQPKSHGLQWPKEGTMTHFVPDANGGVRMAQWNHDALFQIGDTVTIHGMGTTQIGRHLDGKVGTILRFTQASGRFLIRLRDEAARLPIKSENLKLDDDIEVSVRLQLPDASASDDKENEQPVVKSDASRKPTMMKFLPGSMPNKRVVMIRLSDAETTDIKWIWATIQAKLGYCPTLLSIPKH